MDNIYGNYDSNGNLVGVFRNPGDVAPFTATDAELEDCCCGCGQDVKEAVAERQKAVGVTPIDTSQAWDLSELKTKVNNIARHYVDGGGTLYNGGDTDTVPRLSSSYADSADTCDELFTHVKDMLETENGSFSYNSSEVWGGTASDSDKSTAKTKAENDYQQQSLGTSDSPADYRAEVRESGGTYYPYISGGTYSFISDAINLYGFSIKYRVFFRYVRHNTDYDFYDKFGLSWVPDEDILTLMETSNWTTSTQYTTQVYGETAMPPEWPGVTLGSYETSWRGFELDFFATTFLIEWDFTYK